MVLNKFKRWRSSKGFGVHSPYAFRLVRDVLQTSRSYSYYAYEDIDAMLRRTHCPLPRATAHLIFRLLIEFRPATISIASEQSAEALKFIVKAACPDAKIVSSDEDFLICDGMVKASPAPLHAVFTNSQNPAAAATIAALQAGHIYKNPSITVIAALPHLPLQTFEVRF